MFRILKASIMLAVLACQHKFETKTHKKLGDSLPELRKHKTSSHAGQASQSRLNFMVIRTFRSEL
jgi:hypothetical protein